MVNVFWKGVFGFFLTLSFAHTAYAGGYDTPVHYTARHAGMGGAAVSYVDDPASLYHNPAGLAAGEGLQLMVNFSPVIADLTTAPNEMVGEQDSDTIFGPFFFGGASWQITDWLAFGWGIFPVASASASYGYETGGVSTTDSLTLSFLELTAGFAINLTDNFRLGASWRATSVDLNRETITEGQNPELQLKANGWSFDGFRVGLQWSNDDDDFHVGVSYRHRTRTEIEGDGGFALSTELDDVSTAFTLPSRLSVGFRRDINDLSIALDIDYTFQSENDREPVEVTFRGADSSLAIANIFNWQNSVTLRLGGEYRFLDGKLPIRLGYVFDGQVTPKEYPTAFGTPPTETHILTAGAGYRFLNDRLFVNLAYALRFGSTTVTDEDLEAAPESSPFASAAGDYSILAHTLAVDISYKFYGVTF